MLQDPFVRKSRIDQLYLNLPQAIFANFFVACMMILVLRSSHSYDTVIDLFIVICIVNLSRLLLYFLNRRGGINRYGLMSSILYHTGIIFSSFTWGVVIILLLPRVGEEYSLFLTLLLVAVGTGGLSNLTPRLYLVIFHIQCIMLPMIYTSFHIMQDPFLERTLGLILYDVFLTIMALGLSRQNTRSILLKYKSLNAMEKLSLNKRRYEAIFQEAPTGILYYNTDLVIQNCNNSFAQILQVPKERLIGQEMYKLPDKRILPALSAITKNEKGVYEGLYHTLGSDIDVWCTMKTSPVTDEKGEVLGGVAIIEDNTERVKIQNQYEHQAYHDALTGLPNRQLLIDRLDQSLKGVQRHGHMGAILFLDLDKFKLINDTMGHRIGDLLLQEVAKRLKNVLRDEDTVARLGGDEFVVLLPTLEGEADTIVHYTNLVSKKIHNVLSGTLPLENQNVQISTSIGVYIFTSDDDSADHILKSADTAMYNAKDLGRNRTSFYHSSMEETMQKQLVLEMELEKALANNELEMYYQPIVGIADQKILGAEALLRWNHSKRGFISPEEIIQTAESSGQILVLGNWIIDKVLAQYKAWLDDDIIPLSYVSINISIKQMLQKNFVEEMIEKITASAIPPGRILFEITENVLISDFTLTVEKIKALRKFGIQFALDDFGTGFSSLSYLKQLPLDKLKIDKLFIRNLLTDHDDYVLIKTILSIAEYFDLQVITEGVEEEAQVEKLAEMGCPLYQGYFCSKPLPPAEFIKLF